MPNLAIATGKDFPEFCGQKNSFWISTKLNCNIKNVPIQVTQSKSKNQITRSVLDKFNCITVHYDRTQEPIIFGINTETNPHLPN